MTHGPVTCREAVSHLEAFLDRELAPDEVQLVQEHLALCVTCTREYQFESAVVQDLKAKLRRIAVPRDFIDRLCASLRTAPPPER